MSSANATEAAVVLVPCDDCGRVGCRIVKRAVELVVAHTPEVAVAKPADCPKGPRRFVLAVDASSACQASAALRECGARPSAVLSAARVLADAGLVKPGVDIAAKVDDLAAVVAKAIEASLESVLAEVRERRRYQAEMAPIVKRFQGIWDKLEALPAPNGKPEEEDRPAVELLAKRARNLFVRFDEIMPPAEWSEPHDLFQDALLCIAYASEGWVAGDADRWEQNVEKARVQIEPLLRRLAA